MTDGQILVVGSLNADLVVQTARFPQPGETLTGSELRVIPGGKGANQAVAAGRLGGNVAMVGALGSDANGQLLRESVEASGADTTHVATLADVATGTAVITVDAEGENTIIVSPGANGRLGVAELDAAASLFERASILCLCLEIDIDVVLESARRARAAGAQVLLNLSPYGPVPAELLELTDILLINEHEAADLLGLTPEQVLTAGGEQTRTALTEHGIPRAVITAGAAGSIVFDTEADAVAVSSPKVNAVDTTGCGDAFMGALALRLAAGDVLAEAAGYAATVGSFAATGAGAQASYPTPEQLAEFVTSHR
ncbi:ribokinase [Mycetocola sp. BIGb0189]|uniref:ribokinase n=1 Tax=Mycetocola sp. BIGb0189 TaxID=2940604 RepID=UPI00216974C4|nr:ribokinase [Mycetocola sp. BIGb0189]MCS4276342.1 ribokinase [Mycetocola sp. BIGb0189]